MSTATNVNTDFDKFRYEWMINQAIKLLCGELRAHPQRIEANKKLLEAKELING